jgi:hypothetical protein
LKHLASWLIIMPAEAPSKVTNCLYLLSVEGSTIYENSFKMTYSLNKALHYIEEERSYFF